MSDIFFSLVVPMYNSEDFIEECLLSVRSQIMPGCELVLIDDGSTDLSVCIVERVFEDELKSNIFRLIKIENSGPGNARNVGVRAARGSYIGFLDSDDILLSGYFLAISAAIENSEPDIVQFHLLRFTGDDREIGRIVHCHRSKMGIYRLGDVREEIFGVGKWFPCTRVFRREILLRHPFPKSKIFYEDLITLPHIFLRDYSVYLVDKVLIGYRDNSRGTTRNHSPAHALTVYDFFCSLSSLPPSNSVGILRLQLARTLIYFKMEMNVSNISVKSLIGFVSSLHGRSDIFDHLKKSDYFFCRFPRSYLVVEWFRQRFKSVLNRFL